MAEYIEREEAVCIALGAAALGNTAFADRFEIAARLRAIPAADVRPVVKAKWVYTDMSRLVCSNCGNPVAFLIWPSNKTISITNRSFWRSDDGSEIDKPVGNGFGFSFTAEDFQKIKELYDALNNELQTARGNKS